MADPAHNPPLTYEASNNISHPQISRTLPPEVETCLKNARFLHLATISNPPSPAPPLPHVSLMNYTFLPSPPHRSPTCPLPPYPTIILTTNHQSLKTQNLLSNPHVSILVHDWVSHRPPTTGNNSSGTGTGASGRNPSPPPPAPRSSLAALLLNMNTSALSSISTTITGTAVFLAKGSSEERWCKEAHEANNTFGDQAREEAGLFGGMAPDAGRLEGADSGSCYVQAGEVRVVVVQVREGRIADWKGGVKDWRVEEDQGNEEGEDKLGEEERAGKLVNGVS